jgi:signal transduction histidine kinase/ActR/RegA family two-component response regulator
MGSVYRPSTNRLTAAAIAAAVTLLAIGAWTQSTLGDRLLPHAFCITASPPLLGLHALSDGLIAVAYLLIPWCIFRYVRLRGDVPFGWVSWLFGAFIVACGATHVFDVITLWQPVYWYSGVTKAFTALVSLGTAWTLYQLTPLALAIPSAEKVRALNERLRTEIETRESAQQRLQDAQVQLECLLAERTAQADELKAVLDHFFANAPIGMAVFDDQTRIVRANIAIAAITKRDVKEFAEGRPVHELEGLPEEARRSIDSVVHGAAGVTNIVYNRDAPDGAVVLSASYFPIAAKGGRMLTGALVQDITQQQRAEKERQEALEVAQAASDARDQFLARVSHELRSPLQVAMGCAEVLRRTPQLPDKAQHTVRRLSNAVKQQARMIGDLVDLSRMLSAKLHLELSPIDPREPVSAAVDAVSEAASGRGLEIVVNAAREDCLVSGDAARLLQVFVNILDNAIRFSPEGSAITVTCGSQGGAYRVSVSDQGPGVPPSELSSLFDQFVQGAQQPRRGQGLGLGLAIVRGIVASHGGNVTVESGEVAGATFHVTLPIFSGRTTEQTDSAFEESVSLKGLKVLYVEDDVEIGEGVLDGLRSLGADVLLANTFDAALKAWGEHAFDAVLSDINLGRGPGGLELVRAIRNSDPERRTLVIALSAYGLPRDIDAAKGAGIDSMLVKPAHLSEIARELSKVERNTR